MTKYPTQWQRKTMWAALTAVFIVLLIAIVCSAIWMLANVVGFIQPILIPVAISVILAYLLDPLVTKMCEKGLGRTKAVIALFAIAFLSIAVLVAWLAPVVSMQATNVGRELPQYTQKARDYIVDLIFKYDHAFGGPSTKRDKGSSPTTSLLNWLFASPSPSRKSSPSPAASPGAIVTPEIAPSDSPTPAPRDEISPTPDKISSADRLRIQGWVQRQMPNLERQLPFIAEKIWALLQQSIGGFLGLTGFLLSLVMVPIYLFFLLKESPAIEKRWREYLPLRNSPLKTEVASVLEQINKYVIAYFRGQLLVCLIDGTLIGTVLYIYPGLNFAPLIGLLVVILTMIPYVGIILSWIPAVLIAAGQWGDWQHPLIVTAVFVVVQNLEAIFIAPRIVGNSVGLHPMTVIVSIFVWGLLIGGLLGPILAVPLTATIKVLLARYVWGRRLREKVADAVEEVPVVKRAEIPA
jgi:predicted PurR-regulated permease PerM